MNPVEHVVRWELLTSFFCAHWEVGKTGRRATPPHATREEAEAETRQMPVYLH